MHETEVECISKGKEHKKYEFGNKVSIIRSIDGVIIGALSFRKEHDVRTLVPSLEQVSRLTNRKIKILAGHRGYRGLKKHSDTIIEIPSTPNARDSRYEKAKKKKLSCKRAGIEPTIGHLKRDHRLGRNFYKGLQGDAINVMLAAAAYNFKRAMRALWLVIKNWIFDLLKTAEKKNEDSLRLKFGF